MILRNPSSKRDSLFITCSLCCFLFSISLSAQGVIGVVKENVTNHPIAGAIISIIKGDSIIASSTTDDAGQYTYTSTEAQRISISLQALGYKPQITSDILLDGYSTIRQENFLEINAFNLEGVTVTSTKPVNPFIQTISPEDLITTAANYDDPVRVAQSKPGIVLLNDQANHISARGESPLFNSWYLEGLEIVNPNHTNNAGTLSDYPTQSGGGINMFSAQVLGSTDLYTGLNPLNIGRSAGAVIDMHLHETAKPEFRAKAGFLGFEFGGGKAIGKNSILDLNLRYSFTGLLADMGVDFGGEKIGFYDGVIAFRNTGLKHNLKIYSWAGRSTNEFDHVGDPADIEKYKDFFDIDYSNDLYGGGIKFDYLFNPKFSFRTGASLSASKANYSQLGQFDTIPVNISFKDELSILSSMAEFKLILSPRFSSNIGLDYTKKHFYGIPLSPLQDESFIRPYVNGVFELSEKFKLEAGGEINHSFLNDETIPGYRAVIKWTFGEGMLYAGARHAAGQALSKPYTSPSPATSSIIIDKYELGFNSIGKRNSSIFKLYREHIHRMSMYDITEGIIHLADYFDPIIDLGYPMNIDGIGHYYGFEEEYKHRGPKGWSYTFNVTFYKSERGSDELEFTPGKFDGKVSSNLLVSKEIIQEKKGKNRIWNFSTRGIFNGGLYEPLIDKDESQAAGKTVYIDPGTYNVHLQDYFRIDLSVSRTIATSKIRWRYALDVQNLFGLTNVGYHYYDPYLQRIEAKEQLGIIPVFSIQASW